LYRFTIQLYGVSKYDLTWRSFDALDFGEIEYALYNSSSSKKTDESEEEDEEESSSTCCCRSLNMRCTIAAAVLAHHKKWPITYMNVSSVAGLSH